MIGILTYHFAHNYGAMLQAYALKTYLLNAGFDAEIINYCPEKIKKQYSIGKNTVTLKNFWWKAKSDARRKKQYKLFESFRAENLSDRGEIGPAQLKEYSKRFDTVIAGSDQVWNTEINFDDPNYFLDFVGTDTKKFGYAISLGSVKVSQKMRELTDRTLRTFNRVSFREKSAAAFLNEIYKKIYPVTCDPVFLLNAGDWNTLIKKTDSRIPQKYILYYSLHDDENLKSAVMQTAEAENLPILSIHPLCRKDGIADFNLKDVGPREFLWLVKNAEYVASNSFHATAFSIIFEKKALIRPHPVLGDRNKDLLSLVRGNPSLQQGDVYRFEYANREPLNDLIKYSKCFLTDENEGKYQPVSSEEDPHPVIFGVKSKDFEKRASCQSGGAATIIAEYFISQGAVVYGCGFDDRLNVVYHRVTKTDELSLLKGSKYVRADLGDTFRSITQDLKNQRKVLFIGNACNVAGLKKLVSSLPEKDNLFTMDFVCHGTPSHELYREYLDWVEKREAKKISSFAFRYKEITQGVETARGKDHI